MKASFKSLYRKSVDGYDYYINIYDDFLAAAKVSSAKLQGERTAKTVR